MALICQIEFPTELKHVQVITRVPPSEIMNTPLQQRCSIYTIRVAGHSSRLVSMSGPEFNGGLL